MVGFLCGTDIENLISHHAASDEAALINDCNIAINNIESPGFFIEPAEDDGLYKEAFGIFLKTIGRNESLREPFIEMAITTLGDRRFKDHFIEDMVGFFATTCDEGVAEIFQEIARQSLRSEGVLREAFVGMILTTLGNRETRGIFINNMVGFFATTRDERVAVAFKESVRRCSNATRNPPFYKMGLYTEIFKAFFESLFSQSPVPDMTLQERINNASLSLFSYFENESDIYSAIMNLGASGVNSCYDYVRKGYEYYREYNKEKTSAVPVATRRDDDLPPDEDDAVSLMQQKRLLPKGGKLEELPVPCNVRDKNVGMNPSGQAVGKYQVPPLKLPQKPKRVLGEPYSVRSVVPLDTNYVRPVATRPFPLSQQAQRMPDEVSVVAAIGKFGRGIVKPKALRPRQTSQQAARREEDVYEVMTPDSYADKRCRPLSTSQLAQHEKTDSPVSSVDKIKTLKRPRALPHLTKVVDVELSESTSENIIPLELSRSRRKVSPVESDSAEQVGSVPLPLKRSNAVPPLTGFQKSNGLGQKVVGKPLESPYRGEELELSQLPTSSGERAGFVMKEAERAKQRRAAALKSFYAGV